MSGEDSIRHNASTESAAPSVSSHSVGQEGYDFQFVEVGEPSNHDEEARSVIRAHVMRDFYGKRRDGREPICHSEILSAASSKEGVSQQARRFKNGPQGLQEIAKKRKRRGSTTQKSETSPPLQVTCTDAAATVQAASRLQFSFAQGDGVADASFTPSGNCTNQSLDGAGGVRPVQGHEPDLESRDQLIGSDPMASVFGAGDPFNTLPIPNCPRTQILIYHATNGILASPLMGQLRTEWLSLATKDLALFHICLSHYAGNYGLAKQERDPSEALRFRMESMRLVNERLEDREAALADGTMATVASLSSYEATDGSLSAVRTHIQGLMKMVRLRGGVHQSGMNPYTMRLVLWADLNCANALACDPKFPPPNDHETRAHTRASRIQRRSSSNASFQGGNIGSLTELHLLHKDLIDKFLDLRYLAGVNSFPDRRQTIERDEQIMRSDEVYFTERRLLTLSNLSGPQNFASSCCIAAIIFIDNHLRGVAFIARIMARHVARLKLSMEIFLGESLGFAAFSPTPRTILWTLYVGGIAAGSRPERGWFVGRLLEFCDMLDLHSWEDTERILKDFLWPVAWDFQGILLWECMEDTRLTRDGPRNANSNMNGLGRFDMMLACSPPEQASTSDGF